MRDKNSAFEADSVPEGLGLGEDCGGGATGARVAGGSRGRAPKGYQSAP